MFRSQVAFRSQVFCLALAALFAFALPARAQQPTPEQKPPGQGGETFAEEVTLPEKTIIYFKGTGNWDAAFETIVDAFKNVNAFLAKQGIKSAGSPMTI